MSVLVTAAVFAGGIVVGVGVAVIAKDSTDAKMIERSLEEGFRTCIEHHTSIDRDGEQADALWKESKSRKMTEQAAKEMARR